MIQKIKNAITLVLAIPLIIILAIALYFEKEDEIDPYER